MTSERTELGAVQQTLFIPLAGRAAETGKRRAVLRDHKAVEMLDSIEFDRGTYAKGAGGWLTVLRTAIFDHWVREFLAKHPDGTVIEVGTGLNTRFERVDNRRAHWIDLDLPDTIELRRRFFADTDRRRMVATSFLDDSWHSIVDTSPGPRCFVAEGVLVYLPEPEMARAVGRLAARFSGAELMLDLYGRQVLQQQHRRAEQKGMEARWAWSCDDPLVLERLGLRLLETVSVARPPQAMRAQLPPRYRLLLPLARPFVERAVQLARYTTGEPSEVPA